MGTMGQQVLRDQQDRGVQPVLQALQVLPDLLVVMEAMALPDHPDPQVVLVLQVLQALLGLQDPQALKVQQAHLVICRVFSWTFQPQQAELQVQVSSISITQQ